MKGQVGEFSTCTYKLEKNPVVRYLFIKQHEGTDDIKPSDRTLFVVNVPQFFSIKCLKHLFLGHGQIERVFMHSKPTSGGETVPNKSKFQPKVSELGAKVAYIIFAKPASLKKALKSTDTKTVPIEMFQANLGTVKWSNSYNSSFVSIKELDEEVNHFMAEYDKKVKEDKEKEKKGEEPDEDGWVTVSKFSKKPKIPRIEAVNKRIAARQMAKHTKQTLMNFYKNQIKDAKMEQIMEMRKRFEKDKAQIAMMRNSRKFKPF